MTEEGPIDTDFRDLTTATPPSLQGADLVPIIWHANAPWCGTGYGTQSALFLPLIEKLGGYRCAFSAFYGLKGSRLVWVAPDGKQFMVYPGTDFDNHGNDVLGTHAKHWFGGSDGMVVLLSDPWVMDVRIVSRLPLIAWIPIDHDPIIPRTHAWLVGSNAIPVAMSRFGQRVMKDAGHESHYVPHGFDPETFRPIPRDLVRGRLGLPQSAFIVGMVAANLGSPSRKGFSQVISAMAEFQSRHKDALLYLHTKLEHHLGENLPAMCQAKGIKVSTSDQYALQLGTPKGVVAALLSSFDVLLNPSMGEGFGIPLIEAQACGTPCITTDFSAMPEVAPIEAGNWTVGGQEIWTAFESYQVMPAVDEIVDRLEQAYADSEEERLARRESVYTWAMDNYQAEHIVKEYWEPVLEECRIAFAWRAQQMIRH